MKAGMVKEGRFFNKKKPLSSKRTGVKINVYHELKKD